MRIVKRRYILLKVFTIATLDISISALEWGEVIEMIGRSNTNKQCYRNEEVRETSGRDSIA